MVFEFATASRIVFGEGAISNIGKAAAGLGKRPLVITRENFPATRELKAQLQYAGLLTTQAEVNREPDINLIQAITALSIESACDLVMGIGGGSVLDTAKAVAALSNNRGNMLEYLEVVGLGKPLQTKPLPIIAIPTTAGTGSEVTKNAVITVRDIGVKVSLRHENMLPTIAIIDPELTYSLPPDITAATGLDALTQLIEPYVCTSPIPIVDALCRHGVVLAANSLRRAFVNGEDHEARRNLSMASLFSGMALANAKLGAVHGFAGVIGGKYKAPHGAICARLLPIVMAANYRALQQRAPSHPSIQRYQELATLLMQSNADFQECCQWIEMLVSDLGIPRLATWGLRQDGIAELVDQARHASSMKGNPIELNTDELKTILEQAL